MTDLIQVTFLLLNDLIEVTWSTFSIVQDLSLSFSIILVIIYRKLYHNDVIYDRVTEVF